MVKRRILCKTKFFANGRPVRTTTKYCITRPRLLQKSLCDHHRRPVLGAFQIDFVRADCIPLPFVVSPVSCAEVRNIGDFDAEFGLLLRSTPEYHGLKLRALLSVLAKRTAISLETGEWVPDPILVSEMVLRRWLQQHDIPAGIDAMRNTEMLSNSVRTFLDLEAYCGADLRRHVALGFTGRRALEAYLRQIGVRVPNRLVRAWHDKCRLYTPGQVGELMPEDTGEYVARPLLTEADLRTHASGIEIRKMYFVEGEGMPRLLEYLRCYFPCKDVTRQVVYNFLRKNPKHSVDHWQQLLLDPFAEYLQQIKGGHYPVPDEIQAKSHAEKRVSVYHTSSCDVFNQSFFKRKLWEDFVVCCNFSVVDLHNVWQFVCKPDDTYCVTLPCSVCGYVFPHSIMTLDPRRRLNMGEVDLRRVCENSWFKQETAHAFVCEYCAADDHLCSMACIESLRTKWRQCLDEGLYWDKRFTKRNYAGAPVRNKHFSHAALERSLTALYARREVARKADCPKRNMYGLEIATSWQIHDEIFYRYGFDVPLPQYYEDAARAKFLGIRNVSDLPERERIDPIWWTHMMRDRHRHAESRRRLSQE